MTGSKAQMVTVDRAQLRGLIAGFRPTMYVSIKVGDLSQLLDELEKNDAIERGMDELRREGERIRFEGRRIKALIARGDADRLEDEPG
jgi:hypothetical protein